jgi:hypothetical protein
VGAAAAISTSLKRLAIQTRTRSAAVHSRSSSFCSAGTADPGLAGEPPVEQEVHRVDRHLQHRRAEPELAGRQAGQRRTHGGADGQRAPRHQRLAVEAEQQGGQAANPPAAAAPPAR